ncbi:MAG: ATP-binding protein [Pseudomonadota bacterium]
MGRPETLAGRDAHAEALAFAGLHAAWLPGGRDGPTPGLDAALDADPDCALAALIARFGLDGPARDALLLAAAGALDPASVAALALAVLPEAPAGRLAPDAARGRRPAPLIHVCAADPETAARQAAGALAALDLVAFRLDAADAPETSEAAAEAARRMDRDMALTGAELVAVAEGDPAALHRLMARVNAPALLVGGPLPRTRRPAASFPAPEDDAARAAAWTEALGSAAQGRGDEIAAVPRQFLLAGPALRTAAEGVALGPEDRLWPRARAEAGLAALVAGPSGAGETMAAEIVAAALGPEESEGLDLFRVDLSAVVSKYVGETEKNIGRIFDAAERAGAVLILDEGDALFGRRTSEERDSLDRHSNNETACLLQRLEAYSGVAIVTTNLRESIDEAFLRRFRFVVEFPFPDGARREAIWRAALPAEAPAEGLDFRALARLSMTGGSIRSIALTAAFLAAEAGGPITMERMRAAARQEYAKLGRSFPEGELRRRR